MEKKKKTLWIIGILILTIMILLIIFYPPKEEGVGLQVHYFNINGVEIFPDNTTKQIIFTNPKTNNHEMIDSSLLDDGEDDGDLIIEKEDIEHNFENGLPNDPEEDIDIPPPKTNFLKKIKNLFDKIKTLTVSTTTKTVRVYSTHTDTYCNDRGSSPGYSYDRDQLNDIGSDEISGGVEVCNGLMKFLVTSLPSDLETIDQIKKVVLHYKTHYVYSDENDGADTDFCVIGNLENIDYTPNDEGEEKDMYYMLELCSGGGYYHCQNQNCGSSIRLQSLYTSVFEDNDDNKWFSHELPISSIVKNEIISNKDGNPDSYLSIGIEGEYDSNDDERVDFRDEGDAERPYIDITYDVITVNPNLEITNITQSVNGLNVSLDIHWVGGEGGAAGNNYYIIDILPGDGTGNDGGNEWEYGVSSSTHSFHFEHVYSSSGTYHVEVSVSTDWEEAYQEFYVEDLLPAYISFEITTTNTGNVPLENMKIQDASPLEFKNALDLNDIRLLDVGQSTTWNSSLIAVKPEWGGTTQTFEVWIEGKNIYTTEVITEDASVNVPF